MWAMMPMFRVFSRANARVCTATAISVPEVRKGLVGLGHLVGVFLALDGCPHPVGGVHQLGGELVRHALPSAGARVPDDPAPGQRLAPVVPDLDGDLVGGAAHALRLDLDDRRDVTDRLIEDVERLLSRGAADLLERVVHDALGNALLALEHHAVDELRQADVGVDRVGQDDAAGDAGSARHGYAPVLSRLAAYLLRACLRVLVPAVSRVPPLPWCRTRGRCLTRPPRATT